MQRNELEKIVAPLLEWYHANHRRLPWRENKNPYRVWVSEIMLQQTRVEAVIPYYERFMEQCPDIASLAACEDEKLFKLWEGLGYYSRARNLKKAAQIICERYHGQFPQEFDDILGLPGIGAYTAGAIASIAFEQAAAAVDGNVLRVITRLTENSQDIMDTSFRKQVTKELEQIYPPKERGDFTQSLMELGAVVCVPNGAPKCEECPMNALCGAFCSNTQMSYPVKKKKAARKVEEKTVLLLKYGDRIAVSRRGDKGVLSGMWELPNADGALTRQQLIEWLADKGLVVEKLWQPDGAKKRIKHIFTHIEWHMICWVAECESVAENNGFTWVTKEQLATEIALPTAFKRVYELAVKAVNCPCRRIKCERHGDCAACKAYHCKERNGQPTACERR